jgi:hypothetical protein
MSSHMQPADAEVAAAARRHSHTDTDTDRGSTAVSSSSSNSGPLLNGKPSAGLLQAAPPTSSPGRLTHKRSVSDVVHMASSENRRALAAAAAASAERGYLSDGAEEDGGVAAGNGRSGGGGGVTPPPTFLPYREGVVAKWTNYFNGWQERYLVLQSGAISYFKSERDKHQLCRGKEGGKEGARGLRWARDSMSVPCNAMRISLCVCVVWGYGSSMVLPVVRPLRVEDGERERERGSERWTKGHQRHHHRLMRLRGFRTVYCFSRVFARARVCVCVCVCVMSEMRLITKECCCASRSLCLSLSTSFSLSSVRSR